MESNDYNGFEHFLKEKADQYKLYPTDKIWANLNDKLHPRKKWPYLVVAALFIGLGISGNIYDSSIANGSARKAEQNNIPGQSYIASIINSSSSDQVSKNTKENPAITRLRIAYVNKDAVALQTENSNSSSYLKVVPIETAPLSTLALEESTGGGSNEHTISSGNMEAGTLIINENIHLPATINLPHKSANTGKVMAESRKSAPKTTAIRVLKPYKNKFELQFYLAPTVSYRKLSGHGIKTINSFSGNYNYSGDVNKIVEQKPMIGTEAGVALLFSLNKKIRFKTGLQFNFSQYETQAYNYTAELVPMTAAGIGHSQINAVSTYRSGGGLERTSLRNQRMMIAVPVGVEWSVINGKGVQFNLAGSIQPTYVINNNLT
jgi:hypothetical protein